MTGGEEMIDVDATKYNRKKAAVNSIYKRLLPRSSALVDLLVAIKCCAKAGGDRLQLNGKMFSLVMRNMLPGLKLFPRSSIVPTSLTIKEILYK
jgi:hypothetical protein